ncbi:retropepsin-like aspartic protease family protein [Roseovarius sp. E0-M6]|uniref:retropepsin-like aspartic protease family protein n=1 Tax=Roseovarius sp. E0-M6 TaxID=3127118 RepID=UPI00300FA6AB
MQNFETANLVYLIVLGSAVVVWFVAANRNSLGKVTQQALLWGLIFLGVIAGVGMWDHIRDTVMPRQSVNTEAGRIELPRMADGHYYLLAEVNGADVRFVVDTGATHVVLSQADAKAAGFDPEELSFHGRAVTANGSIRTAPVRIDRLNAGGIEHRNVRAVVNGGELDTSLLGMSYLQRFESIQIMNDMLILTQ